MRLIDRIYGKGRVLNMGSTTLKKTSKHLIYLIVLTTPFGDEYAKVGLTSSKNGVKGRFAKDIRNGWKVKVVDTIQAKSKRHQYFVEQSILSATEQWADYPSRKLNFQGYSECRLIHRLEDIKTIFNTYK